MNILVVDPGPRRVRRALYTSEGTAARSLGDVYEPMRTKAAAMETPQRRAGEAASGEHAPDIIAVRITYGGEEWDMVAPMDRSSVERLEQLSPKAPLSLPFTCAWLRQRLSANSTRPIFGVFETGFFRSLPEPERSLALPHPFNHEFSRRGYHGIYHDAACRFVPNTRSWDEHAGRILSICLEPRPELAAVRGQTPVMVSGGATPLEGIPGDGTSGEVDPGIVLRLADAHQMGPEQIHRILAERSGLFGLTGERVTLADVLTAPEGEHDLARQVVLYRLLLACGAGVAAMGGVDGICFSGRYAEAAPPIVEYLIRYLRPSQGDVPTFVMTTPLYQLIAERAACAVKQSDAASLPPATGQRQSSLSGMRPSAVPT